MVRSTRLPYRLLIRQPKVDKVPTLASVLVHNVDVLGGSRTSDRAWQASFNVAAGASPFATYACVDTWLTDFRGDLPKIDVPTLVVHGTADRILPFEATAARLRD